MKTFDLSEWLLLSAMKTNENVVNQNTPPKTFTLFTHKNIISAKRSRIRVVINNERIIYS